MNAGMVVVGAAQAGGRAVQALPGEGYDRPGIHIGERQTTRTHQGLAVGLDLPKARNRSTQPSAPLVDNCSIA
jgi:hypothetical protein